MSQLSPSDHATWQHPHENPRHVRGSARICVVRMVQFILKIAKLSHIIDACGSQDLRSPSSIMAPDKAQILPVSRKSHHPIELLWQVLLGKDYTPELMNDQASTFKITVNLSWLIFHTMYLLLERAEFNKSCNLIGSWSGQNFLIPTATAGGICRIDLFSWTN